MMDGMDGMNGWMDERTPSVFGTNTNEINDTQMRVHRDVTKTDDGRKN